MHDKPEERYANGQRRRPFVGGWVDAPTKNKLRALALLTGRTQQQILADLIRNAPLTEAENQPENQPA